MSQLAQEMQEVAEQELTEAEQELTETKQKLMEAEQELTETKQKLTKAELRLSRHFFDSDAALSFTQYVFGRVLQEIQRMESEGITRVDFNLSDEVKFPTVPLDTILQPYSWKNILHNMTDEEISKPIDERYFLISHHFEYIFEEIQDKCYANGYYLLFEFQGKHDTFTLSKGKPVDLDRTVFPDTPDVFLG